MELIDAPALRVHLGPHGPWAKECGARVTKYREKVKQSEQWLATATGVSLTTIKGVEAGHIVPRDYLRAAIAFAVGRDQDDIWIPINRDRVREIGQVA